MFEIKAVSRRYWPGLLLLGAWLQSAMAADEVPEFSATVTLGSDVLFRGVSQTLGGAAAQVYADVTAESGVYAYVWTSNVDFMPDDEPDDGADYEVDAAIGYSRNITGRVSADVVFVRYMFPDTVAAAGYNYNEFIATLQIDEQYHATIAYSDDVFGMDADGVLYEAGAAFELPSHWSLALHYGHYELGAAFGADYSYAGIGISRPIGPVTISLAYYDTFGDAADIFYGQSIGSRFVLSADLDLLD